MSDLFEDEQLTESSNEFNARVHINSICNGGRIIVSPYILVEYKKGWAVIVEELIMAIKKYPIEINQISCDYGQLDVGFYGQEKTQELKVWRAIDKAKSQSRKTCNECGEGGMRRISGDIVAVICRSCIRKAEDNGETGTWLDKY